MTAALRYLAPQTPTPSVFSATSYCFGLSETRLGDAILPGRFHGQAYFLQCGNYARALPARPGQPWCFVVTKESARQVLRHHVT